MDASKIRELLLDFYNKHDPERLNAGLDIFSMVLWTQEHGMDKLNDLLERQYGATINANKRLGGEKAAFNRFSTLLTGKPNERKPVERVIPPMPPRKDSRAPILSNSSGPPPGLFDDEFDDDDMDIPPPPPPPGMDNEEGQFDEQALKRKLLSFYATNDPGKLAHVDSIVAWGIQIGEEELEGKLIQIYGVGFNSSKRSSTDSATSNVSFNSVASNRSFNSPYSSSKNFASSAVKTIRRSFKKPAKPHPRMPPKNNSFAPMPTQPTMLSKSNLDQNNYARKTPTKVPSWNAPVVNISGTGKPCTSYKLDMTGQTFGVCTCGYSRQAHMMQPNGKPSARKKPSNSNQPIHHASTRSNASAGQYTRDQQPVKKSLMKNQFQQSTQQRVDARAHGGEKANEKPCHNFILDMTGNSFGVCNCGFRRDQHQSGVQRTMNRISKKLFNGGKNYNQHPKYAY